MTDEVRNEVENAQAGGARKAAARELAAEIIRDLQGNGYYADPSEMAARIGDRNADLNKAIEIIRTLLRMYSGGRATPEMVLDSLASMLESQFPR